MLLQISEESFLSKVNVRILLIKKCVQQTLTSSLSKKFFKKLLFPFIVDSFKDIIKTHFRKYKRIIQEFFEGLKPLCFEKNLEAYRNFDILVKKSQCNEAMNGAIFEWQTTDDVLQNKLFLEHVYGTRSELKPV